jgi:hypothetical protein
MQRIQGKGRQPQGEEKARRDGPVETFSPRRIREQIAKESGSGSR